MKKIKQLCMIICVIEIVFMAGPQYVNAGASYDARTMTSDGQLLNSQLPYIPGKTITSIGDETLNGASDIICDVKNRLLYIADTNNKRILVSDYEGNFVRIIGEGILSMPQGICLGNKSGNLFVADRKEEKVYQFTPDGELLKEYTAPTEPLFGKNSKFQPMKVATDIADNLYIISNGNTNGIIQMDTDGNFLGYFGANKTQTSLWDIIRRQLYSKEQLADMIRNMPKTPSNLASDTNGLIYTITAGVTNGEGFRKLNMAGSTIFSNYTDPMSSDITVSAGGTIYSVSKDGFILEYTREGYLLFIFGGTDDGTSRTGLFTNLAGIAADEDENLYVIDGSENIIQIFNPSEFKKSLIPALDLYFNGHFERSKEPWQEVLKENRTFQYAYVGLGEAEFKLGNYKEAMKAYYNGSNYEGYSAAFWEVRNEWLNKYIMYCIFAIVMFFIFKKIIKVTNKRYGYLNKPKAAAKYFFDFKLCRELKYIKYFIKHPFDAYYGIRFQGKTSVLSATIIYLTAFMLFIINKYYCGFIFKTVPENYYNLLFDIALVGGVGFFLIICNYLVSTIRDGEGSFKVVYMSVAYSLMPYVFIKPILFIFTHILTYNEQIILNIGGTVTAIWFAALIFIMISEIHRYEISGVIKNILITFAAALVMGIILFIIYLMFNQLNDFTYSFTKEVLYRVGY